MDSVEAMIKSLTNREDIPDIDISTGSLSMKIMEVWHYQYKMGPCIAKTIPKSIRLWQIHYASLTFKCWCTLRLHMHVCTKREMLNIAKAYVLVLYKLVSSIELNVLGIMVIVVCVC